MVFLSKSKIFIAFLIFLVSLLGLSWVTKPVPAPYKEISVGDPEIDLIFKRSCFDCHTSQTKWPWYSNVFPVSVWIKHHQEEGMEEWDLESWNDLSKEKKKKLAYEILEEIEEGEMPLFSYRLVHREANITEEDLAKLKNWAGRYE